MNKDVVIRLRMTQEDADDLNKKVKLTGLTKSSFIRVLIKGYIPKPKPDKEFYVLLRKIYAVCNDMNQLTAKAHTLNFIDVPMLKKIKSQHENLLDEIQKKYLAPDKNDEIISLGRRRLKMINNIELTKSEYDLLNKIRTETYAKLSAMTSEERLEWFAHYPYPLNLKKEINGTVYTVNTHFNDCANETIIEKAERIILKK